MTYTETKAITKESQQSSGQPVLSFDGKDDFIYFGKANPIKTPQGTFERLLNFSQTTTLECWIKLDSYKNNFIFSQFLGGDKPAVFYGLFIDEQKKIPMFIYSTTDKQNQILSEAWDIESAKIHLDEWYHLAVIVDNKEVELFIDGESQGSMKLEANIADNPAAELFIGKSYSENSYFSGQITEVRIWNTARTPDNIEENMSRPLENVNNKELSLKGYWMLNRGSEFTACDSTSNDQYGIINGATWVTSEDLPLKPATPKEQFVYADNGLAMFDADKVLPAELQATTRWLANFHQSFKGIGGTVFHMGIMDKEKTPLPYMPANLTSLHPHKYSDEYFVERRLNGINPGQLKRVENQTWNYIIKYDFGNIEIDKFAIFPKIIEARFCLDGTKLNPHSIEYTLHGETEIQTYTPLDTGWERAKEIFRTAELVYHESRCHLGRTHINIDQYAMALYRNVVNNPIKKLLDPHLEGVLNINQRGGSNIIGFKTAGGTNVDGMIPDTSAISLEGLNTLLKEEISGLTYRNWSPREYTIPDYVENNYFDQAAIAMWNILTDYVKNFFEEHHQDIQEYWSEIEGMSEDLSSHSILKPELGTLDIKTMHDLKQLCVYVIYMSSFYHSWVNMKQYEDGGDVEFGAMGLWEQVNPQENLGEFKQQFARKTRQSTVLLNLTSVRYNLIMDVGSTELKNAIWKQRHLIEPGLPLNNLLMSISI